MMRQISYSRHGPPSVLQLHKVPRPKRVKPNEILVKIHAAAVNAIDWKVRWFGIPGSYLPFYPGCDFAGEVVERDDESKFTTGQKVFGMLPILGKAGSLADYVVVDEKFVSSMPEKLSYVEAASIPLVGLAVWQALSKAKITDPHATNSSGGKKKKILVHAGSGGVGSMALQLCKALGLEVYTTCSGKNAEFCKSLGADVVIDYTKEKFEKLGVRFDYIIDTIGGNYELRSMHCIKWNGVYFSIINSGWATKWATGKSDGVSGADSGFGNALGFVYAGYRMMAQWIVGPYYKMCFVEPNGRMLGDLSEFIAKNKLKPVIDKTFPLESTEQAYEYMQTGHARGKVVINLDDAVASEK